MNIYKQYKITLLMRILNGHCGYFHVSKQNKKLGAPHIKMLVNSENGATRGHKLNRLPLIMVI